MQQRQPKRPIHGWINLDKPYGMTSTQAVSAIKRLLRPEKIGHAGTLDPLATGILPLALGEATKTVPFMMDAVKRYCFTIRWGEETTTCDSEGEISARSDHRPSQKAIIAIIADFVGAIQQVPPAYSALKINGKRAYDLARAGETVELEPREIIIDDMRLVSLNDADSATFEVTCGKGTYIRSLARDMALALGTVGHVSMLKRTAVGAFDEKSKISLEKCDEIVHKHGFDVGGPARDLMLLPPEAALDDIPAIRISQREADDFRHGRRVSLSDDAELLSDGSAPTGLYQALCEGTLVALVEPEAGEWVPKRVFNL